MKYFEMGIWLAKYSDEPVPHGYTRQTEDNRSTLRIGPLVFAWEFVSE